MKLRNKKTGEIEYLIFSSYPVSGDIVLEYIDESSKSGYSEFCRYTSLADLNRDWEDYEPKEPLIKDEKVRKAVRAWAEANGVGGCVCKEEIHCITFETERGMFISFENADPIPPEGNFTIAELCGDEEA